MTSDKCEVYGVLGPPKTQPRSLDFEKVRGWKVSGRKGRGEKFSPESLSNLSINDQTKNGDEVALETENSLEQRIHTGFNESENIIMNEKLLKDYNVNLDENASIKAGDVITVAAPFVSVLATGCRGKRCERCFLEKKVKLFCDKCNYANYCSQECLEEDRSIHEKECYYFSRRRSGGLGSDTCRMILRIILTMRSPVANKLCDIVPGRKDLRFFADLVDHFDDIVNSSNRFEMVNQYYDQIIQLMGEADAPDPNYFLECYGRMAINSFNILDDNDEAVGTALYVGPSVMNHSCRPNASVRFENNKNIVVRALEDMESRDFSQIFISYIDVMETTQRRQSHLMKNYYFLCQCPRCLNTEFEKSFSCIKCVLCGKGEVFVGKTDKSVAVEIEDSKCIDVEPCKECNVIQDSKAMDDYAEVYEVIRSQHDQTEFPFDLAKFCLSLMKRVPVFGKFHILNIKVSECAFDGYLSEIDDCEKRLQENIVMQGSKNNEKDNNKKSECLVPKELLEQALEIGLFLIEAHQKFSMHLWAKEAIYMAQVSKIEQKLGRLEDARSHLNDANRILNIAKGELFQI